MDKIVHLDEMKPNEFITFVKQFANISDTNIEVSEKIDGQNISFGLNTEDKFFTKTKKSKPVFDLSFYAEIDFMSSFKSFHSSFSKALKILKQAKDEVQKQNKTLTEPFDFQVFGELLPSAQTNLLKYNKEQIGEGAIVLFDVKINGDSILDESYANKIFSILLKLNGTGGWKVYFKNIMNPNEFQFNVNHMITLETLYKKYFEVLNSRKAADKDIKQKAQSVIQSLMDNIKKQFLAKMLDNRKSMLGNIKPEGLILRDFTNKFLVKLVDKDDFSEANKEMHGINKAIQELNRKALMQIKSEIFGNADILKNFAKVIEKATDKFFVEKQKNPSFKFQSLDAILKVAYDDMVDEGRISLSATEAINKLIQILNIQLEDLQSLRAEWDAQDKTNTSDVTINVTNSSFDNAKNRILDVISSLESIGSSNGIKVYLTIIYFVFGPKKVDELKTHFNV